MADRRSYTLKEGRTRPGEPLAFVDAAIQHRGHECLLFPFAIDKDGYGRLTPNGRHTKPHQLVCEAAHGPKPSPEYEVAHSCRNAPCCNPSHLRWDTRKGNVRDCVGDARKFAKLTSEMVLAIRSLPDRSQSSLASEFGVSKKTIWAILHRKKWGWLDTPAIQPSLQRIFRCCYFCDECSVEWDDEMLVQGMSWCPGCDQETEPHLVDEFEEYRLEWED